MQYLITAGPTREHIDPVRFLSNESSGRMGVALAEAALARGHAVTLVHGPIAVAAPAGCRAIEIVSAADMLAACRAEWPAADVLIMAAAVADYRPAATLPQKRKKSAARWVLELEPTTDILATLSANRRPGQTVIGFALEDVDMRRRGEDKLRRKNLDGLVLNSPAALNAAASTVELLDRDGRWTSLPPADKRETADAIITWSIQLAAAAK